MGTTAPKQNNLYGTALGAYQPFVVRPMPALPKGHASQLGPVEGGVCQCRRCSLPPERAGRDYLENSQAALRGIPLEGKLEASPVRTLKRLGSEVNGPPPWS